MRPIRLTFSGLRSYRATAEIDFEGLELFAVVGDTGAGKSTIIEALSLALYATKTWQGGASKTEMIADGEPVMRVELVFEADGHEWTVTRSWRRSGQGVNKLVRADKGETVDGSTAVTERVTQLLGLTHAQFTQAVVMPQGRFDKLLQATPSDRNRLLASILGLDAVRRVGTDAARIRDEWLPTVEQAAARRQVLPLDPPAELAAAAADQVAADERLALLRSAVARIGGHEDRVSALRAAHDRLRPALAAVAPLERDPVAELDAARVVGERLAGERRALVAEQRELDETLERLGRDAAKTLGGFRSRDDAVEARTSLRSASSRLRDDLAALDTARNNLASVQADAPPPDIDPALTQAATEAEARAVAARESHAAAGGAHRDALDRWAALAAARKQAADAAAARSTATDQLEAAGRVVAEAVAARDAAASALVDAQAVEAAALAADAAAAVAASCQPGDDCPVCARPLPDDFTVPAAGDLDAARARTAEAQLAAQAARDASSAAGRDEEHLRRALAQAVSASESADAQLVAAIDAARDAGCDPDGPDVETATAAVRATLAAAEQDLEDAVTQQRAAADAVASATAAARTAAALYEAATATATAAVEAADRRVAAHVRVATALPDGWVPGGEPSAEAFEQVADDIDAMLVSLAAIEDERAAAARSRADTATAIVEIEHAAKHEVTRSAESALAAVNQRLASVRAAALAAAEAPAPATGADADPGDHPDIEPGATGSPAAGGGAEAAGTEVDEAPAHPLDGLDDLPATARTAELPGLISTATEALAAADAALVAAEATLRRVEDELTDRRAQLEASLEAVGCPTVADLHTQAGAASERAAAAAERVDAARDAVDAAERLDRFLAEARPFVANLSVLAVALRDQHFVGHLVKAREVELIAEANRRLRAITGDRFGFVGDFGVVSVASGEIRSPDALSGGERFQAALALALSLVEIASRGRGRLDAVFVDEGFGSLDTAALDSALDTLGLVAGGGKMVGLISHLKPVAEYVESVLLVTKDDVLGSTIQLLDPDERDAMLADDIRSGLTSG